MNGKNELVSTFNPANFSGESEYAVNILGAEELKKAKELNEHDLKLAVAEYLQYLTNQGKFYADRLNSGEVIEVRGKTRRRIKLCREGTADFFVLIHGQLIFFECKGEKGKQSPAQKAFEIMIKAHRASYYIIRSMEQLEQIMAEYL